MRLSVITRSIRAVLCGLLLAANLSFAAPQVVAAAEPDWSTPPVADLGPAHSAQLRIGETLTLDASASYEPDAEFGDQIISYEWDLNDDGVYESMSGIDPMYVITDFENRPAEWSFETAHRVTLRITDQRLNQSTASIWVWYGMSMPSVRVLADGSLADPARLDFGKVPVGTSKMMGLSFENSGSSPYTVNDVDFIEWTMAPWGERLPLTLDVPCEYQGLRVAGPGAFPLIIGPGETRGFGVDFTPTEVGSREGTLVVQLWDGPVEVPWTAEGFINNVPVAESSSVTVVRGNAVVLPLAATDADGDPITFDYASLPFPGTIEGDGSGVTRYRAPRDFVGTTSLTYWAFDGYERSNYATIDITVLEGPDLQPTVDSQTVTLPLGQPSIYITVGGDDPEGNVLLYQIVDGPQHGSLYSPWGGTWRYTPTPGDNALSDSFTFRAWDGNSWSEPGTVSINIERPNQPPVVQSQSLTLPVGQNTIDIYLTGADPKGAPLDYSNVDGPYWGQLDWIATGHYRYTVGDRNASPSDEISFVAWDGALESAPATVHIDIEPDLPPVANPVNVTVPAGSFGVDFDLDGFDPEGQSLAYYVFDLPTNGTLLPIDEDTFTYIPNPGFSGVDTLSYRVVDGSSWSDTGTVTITVEANLPPVADDQTVDVTQRQGMTLIELTATDPEGVSPLDYMVETGPQNGTLDWAYDNVYRYTPTWGYSGPDSFTFRAGDGAVMSASATVSINVIGDATPIVSDQTVDLPQRDGSAAITLSAVDPEGWEFLDYMIWDAPQHGRLEWQGSQNFVYFPEPGFTGTDTFTYRVGDGLTMSAPATVSINVIPDATPIVPDRTIDLPQRDHEVIVELVAIDPEGWPTLDYMLWEGPQHGQLQWIDDSHYRYVADYGFTGVDTFTYRVGDGVTMSAPATVSINVIPDATPIAQPVSVTTPSGAPVMVTLAGSDPEGWPTLDYLLWDLPAHGQLQWIDDTHYLYTPEWGFAGSDTFTYMVGDGVTMSAPATVTITVEPNQPPTADAQTVTLPLSESEIYVFCTGSDPEGVEPMFEVENQPQYGTLTPTGPGVWRYVPNDRTHTSDSFTFKTWDGSAWSAPATVTINIEPELPPVNLAPSAAALSATADGSTSITLAGSDPEGAALTYEIVSAPAHGSLANTGADTFTYAPQAGYAGADSFTYRVSDGVYWSSVATVSITVVANQAPEVASVNAEVAAGGSTQVTLIGLDADNDPLTYEIVVPPAHGTLVAAGGATFTYTPAAGYSGVDWFTYRASDGQLVSNQAVGTIAVRPQAGSEPEFSQALPAGTTTNVLSPVSIRLFNAAGIGGQVGDELKIDGRTVRAKFAYDVAGTGRDEEGSFTIYDYTHVTLSYKPTKGWAKGTHTVDVLYRDANYGKHRFSYTFTVQ